MEIKRTEDGWELSCAVVNRDYHIRYEPETKSATKWMLDEFDSTAENDNHEYPMKSAEEWSVRLCEEVHTGGLRINAKKLVQQIQLDAMKEGMRRAAEIATNELAKYGGRQYIKFSEITKPLLTAAEQLTSESL